jgi:hypothetical protein
VRRRIEVAVVHRGSAVALTPNHREQRTTRGTTMNTIWKAALLGLALATTSLSSIAQAAAPATASSTPRVDQRQGNQEKRIDQGVASGQLTRRETRRLEREQNAINRAENRAKADGVVTMQERRQLQHAQNHASRDIARQKHDRQRRGASAPAS